MRKLIITVIVIMAVASALLLVALVSWTTYQHYHERTGYPTHLSNYGTWRSTRAINGPAASGDS